MHNMRKQLPHLLFISLIFFLIPTIQTALGSEENRDRLLIIPLKAKIGIKQEEASLLTDLLSVEIHRSGKFTILNREDMKAVLSEIEFEMAMGCEDNVCLLENVAKLSVNKIIAGSIGKLGRKYIISIRMINEDGENEVMVTESCACRIDELDKTIEQISYKFLRYLDGNVTQNDSIGVESKTRRENESLSHKSATDQHGQVPQVFNDDGAEIWDLPEIISPTSGTKSKTIVKTGFAVGDTIKNAYQKASTEIVRNYFNGRPSDALFTKSVYQIRCNVVTQMPDDNVRVKVSIEFYEKEKR